MLSTETDANLSNTWVTDLGTRMGSMRSAKHGHDHGPHSLKVRIAALTRIKHTPTQAITIFASQLTFHLSTPRPNLDLRV